MANTIQQIKDYIAARFTSGTPRDISGQDGREALSLLADELAYTTELDDATTSAGVGGIPAGTTAFSLKGQKLSEILDQLIFPLQNPTYISPSLSVTAVTYGGTGVAEIGSTVSMIIIFYCSKNDAGAPVDVRTYRNGTLAGTILLASMITESLANVPDQLGQPNPNSPNARYSVNYIYASYTALASPSVNSFFARWRYSAGLAKNNNRGVPDARTALVRNTNAPQAAETTDAFESATVFVTNIYPYFWGISDTQPTLASIQALLSGNDPSVNKVVATAATNITINYNTAATPKFHWFAIPVGGGVPAPDRATWYFSETNNGNFLGGAGKLWNSKVTGNLDSPTGLWTAQSYKVYWTQYATSFESAIQLRV